MEEDKNILLNNLSLSIKHSINNSNMETFNYLIEKYGIDIITEEMLYDIVKNGNLEMLKYLLDIKPDLDISFHNELGFRTACKLGYIDMVIYMLEIKPCINISVRNEEAFLICCDSGNIEILDILVYHRPEIKKSKYLNTDIFITEHAFIMASNKGNIELTEWLLYYDPNIDISIMNEKAFERACYSGNIEMVKWLLEIKPDINIRIYDDEIFILTSHMEYIEISDVLIENCKELINYKNVDTILKNACKKGKLGIVEWLLNKKEVKNLKYLNHNNLCEIAILNKNNDIAKYFINLCINKNYFLLLKVSAMVGNKEMFYLILNKRNEILDMIDYNFYCQVYDIDKNQINYIIDYEGYENIREYLLDVKPEIMPRNCFCYL